MLHSLENLILGRRISSVNALFANTALRSSAIALFGIFEPIYIYSLTGRVESALLYSLAVRSGALLLCLPAGKAIAKLGFRRSVLVSNFFLAGLLIFLLLAKRSVWFLVPAAVFSVPATLFYWLPFHILMIDDSDHGHLGGELSFMTVITNVFHIMPPFVGGLLITFGGFTSLYILAIFLALLSSLPLFFMPHHRQPKQLEYLRFFRSFPFPKLSVFIHGFDDFFSVIVWPIFMYLVLRSYEQVGTLTSLMLFAVSIFLVLIGHFIDRGKALIFYRVGTVLSSIAFPLRALLITPVGVLAVDSFHNVARLSQKLPFDFLHYQNSPKGFEYEYVIIREMFLSLGRLTAAVIAFWALRNGLPWFYLFLLPAAVNLLLLPLRELKP